MSVASPLERLERVLAMVPWLLEHPATPLDELAQRFETTREQIAADLDILGYCGLPGYGGGDLVEVVIFGDLVTVRMADFFARPLRLSVREAVTLLLAARALSAVGEVPGALHRAIERLEELLQAEPEVAGEMRVALDVRPEDDELLARLRVAVRARRVVRVRYRSASREQTRERAVEPWAVVTAGGAWYLQGWCRSAAGRRDFRLDRIADAELTDEVLPRPPEAPRPVAYEPREGDLEVVLDVDDVAWWRFEPFVLDAVEERSGHRRVTLRTPAPLWLARAVLRAGPAVRVVTPKSLRLRVHELASAALGHYEPTTDGPDEP